MPLADLPALLDRIEQGTAGPEERAALEALAEEAPGYATAHVALAHVCEQEGDREEAHRSWKRARLLLPASPAVREGLRRTIVPKEPDSAERPGQQHPEQDDGAAADRPSTGAENATDEPAASPRRAAPTAEDLLEDDASPDADLDGLIEELEGARIDPTPDPDDVPAPDLDADDSDVVSPTLARIYEAQGQLSEAARVHRRLAEKHPGEAEEHHRQADALDARAAEEEEARSSAEAQAQDGTEESEDHTGEQPEEDR